MGGEGSYRLCPADASLGLQERRILGSKNGKFRCVCRKWGLDYTSREALKKAGQPKHTADTELYDVIYVLISSWEWLLVCLLSHDIVQICVA